MDIKTKTADGRLIKLESSLIDALQANIHGEIITPQDKEYDSVRVIWNSMIDKKPSLIIRCSGTADVIKAVRFAKEHNLLISVRGAGHNIAGRALDDHVLLIDLSKLHYVHVNPEEAIATVSPGANLADVDQETQIHGLVLPTGINSTTGVGGLTLGGGFGWLSRKYGMTIDSLISAEIVTVDGDRIVCNEKEHPELFWAIRGGGGNFGIITSFTFKLHKVGPTVLSGPVIYKIDEAKKVLRGFREFCKKVPDEVTVWSVIRLCPPFPFVDSSYHGKPVVVLVGMYAGPVEEGEKYFQSLKELGSPIGHDIGPHPFVGFQKSFDPLLSPRARNYWKTLNFKELDDGLIDTLVKFSTKLPGQNTELFFAHLGGRVNRVAKDATAYPYRDVEFIMNVHTRWENKNEDNIFVSFAREIFKETKPYATSGGYVNFVSEGDDNVDVVYSENLKKLAAIKTKYDPKNILRSNLNISPN